MLLLLALCLIFTLVALTRPRRRHGLRDRYRRPAFRDPPVGLRDPSRPF
jgi:hypothetical protein